MSLQNTIPFKEDKLIISLYDYTGKWARPYIDAGYPVMLWDKKVEGDILEGFSWLCMKIEEAMSFGYIPYGVLIAPPCDDFAGSGARWWAGKDSQPPFPDDEWNGVDYSKALVEIALHLIDLFPTIKFWALENPVGRIEKLIPHLKGFRKLLFNPCDYGDPYTKKTILWGVFNHNLKKTPVEPVMYERGGKKGSYMWANLGGKSERTKSLRSATPKGFAKAFFEANQ